MARRAAFGRGAKPRRGAAPADGHTIQPGGVV
jgi:hypothetical protein